MGLGKKIKQDDGVQTGYHRILFLQITPNQQNSIVVSSYVDEETRLTENVDINKQPYKKIRTYETDYDPDMTIDKAYKWLKKHPDFVNAEDVQNDSKREVNSKWTYS